MTDIHLNALAEVFHNFAGVVDTCNTILKPWIGVSSRFAAVITALMKDDNITELAGKVFDTDSNLKRVIENLTAHLEDDNHELALQICKELLKTGSN